MLLFGAAYLGARRAMAKDQRRPVPCDVPLWRLLLEEVGLLARRVGRWRLWSVLGVAFVCYLTVEVALSTETPGPALAELWRWVVAMVLTAVTLGVWAIGLAIWTTRTVPSSTT
ncbi:hypothetical protein [Actinospongicola halichondriae]|uniref:hypothetical protein n=1 Tax=Actinospongicola halichondriae TaxID=3236844 RepID=UPI003D3D1A5E